MKLPVSDLLMKKNMNTLRTRTHLLSGASLTNLIVVLYNNRAEISLRVLPQILLILITPLLFYPLYLLEIMFFSKKIKRTRILKDPVFIIGHWRSGTTYMHNLLCRDLQFGFPTTYQCFVPGMFLSGGDFTKAIHKTTLPEKRPMDDVTVDSDFPQEEEFMISALSPYSYYQTYFFPKKIIEYFRSFALVKPEILPKWEKIFLFLVKKITYVCEGKQLVLKNPVHTVRIKHLIRMFPHAKFIYMHRDPDEVLKSTKKLFDKFLELYSFQEMEEQELQANISWVHLQMLSEYAEQKKHIAQHNLVEVDYAGFIKEPLTIMERIYHELQFNGFELAKDDFRKYILEQASFKF
jgi:hypothetical protein